MTVRMGFQRGMRPRRETSSPGGSDTGSSSPYPVPSSSSSSSSVAVLGGGAECAHAHVHKEERREVYQSIECSGKQENYSVAEFHPLSGMRPSGPTSGAFLRLGIQRLIGELLHGW